MAAHHMAARHMAANYMTAHHVVAHHMAAHHTIILKLLHKFQAALFSSDEVWLPQTDRHTHFLLLCRILIKVAAIKVQHSQKLTIYYPNF
jgi:hypothetical protein